MAKPKPKYIFVTGGVLSGVGKGITAASIANILKARGLRVNIMKCDPYLNTDAGTLNPAEHGEVYVTADGGETDLDLGHYERFLNQNLSSKSSLMNGRILAKVIADERDGKYLGKTVQIIPHVTGEIQKQIEQVSRGFDVQIVEIGGTVGDYESLAFIEAVRQFHRRVGAENALYVHLVYIPYIETTKEFKTKPAQNAIRDLREAGIQADVVIARSERPLGTSVLSKLSLYGDVPAEGIAALPNAKSVYEVPLRLEEAGIGTYITKKLKLGRRRPKLAPWRKLVETMLATEHKHLLRVGIVAKYMGMEDTYKSVFEAIQASAWAQKAVVEMVWIDAEKLESENGATELAGLDGIVVPGGFGSRGVEGKILAADYAMTEKVPYLGLCLGMQVAVIAHARRVLGTRDVNTTEVAEATKHPVIHLMQHQRGISSKGGTMRLGDYPCALTKGSLARKLYGKNRINERHRHRYEFNNSYRQRLEVDGFELSGLSPDGELVEIIEIKNHPFFVASQFHPEFTARPMAPQPLFSGFIAAIIKLQTDPADRPSQALTGVSRKTP